LKKDFQILEIELQREKGRDKQATLGDL